MPRRLSLPSLSLFHREKKNAAEQTTPIKQGETTQSFAFDITTGTATAATRTDSIACEVIHCIPLALNSLPDVPEEEESDIAETSSSPASVLTGLTQCLWFGLFDGVGSAAPKLASSLLHRMVMAEAQNLHYDFHAAMVTGFQEVDERIRQHPASIIANSLTSALVVLVVQEELVVANAGTSKAIWVALESDIPYVELNKPHTADQFPEKQRVVSNGGRVTGGVVNGRGRATRALGVTGPGVVAIPDVKTFKLDPTKVNVVVAATSVAWDILGTQDVAKRVVDQMSRHVFTTADQLAGIIARSLQSPSQPSSAAVIVTILRPPKERLSSIMSASSAPAAFGTRHASRSSLAGEFIEETLLQRQPRPT